MRTRSLRGEGVLSAGSLALARPGEPEPLRGYASPHQRCVWRGAKMRNFQSALHTAVAMRRAKCSSAIVINSETEAMKVPLASQTAVRIGSLISAGQRRNADSRTNDASEFAGKAAGEVSRSSATREITDTMTFVGNGQENTAESRPAAAAPAATIKTKLADLWPLAMIAFGLGLTVALTAGILWLSLSLLLSLF